MGRELVNVELRWRNSKVLDFNTQADTEDVDDLQRLWEEALKRHRVRSEDAHEYTIRLRRHSNGARLIDYVGRET